MRRVVGSLCSALAAATVASAQSLPEWRFVEDLRIGSENDDPTGFSDIRGLLVDRKGNIWVLEFSTQEIRVFDPTGHHLRNIGRKGQGPGEFIYPDGMALAPDGLIWVHDPKNARFSIFDQDGKFVRQHLVTNFGYGYLWWGGIDRAGRIWDRLFVPDPKNIWASKTRRAAADWSRVDTLSMPECHLPGAASGAGIYRSGNGSMMTIPYYASAVSSVDYSDGAVWCAPNGAEYRLLKIGIERNDTLARITGHAEAVAVSATERDSAIARVQAFLKRLGETSADFSLIPRVKPLIRAAFVDDENRLWVRRSSSEQETVFDLYTRQGKALATLRIPHSVSSYHRPVVRASVAYLIVQEEGEVPYVIRGRIQPR